jgi:hypothetical protein
MRDPYTRDQQEETVQQKLSRFFKWLSRRPSESWMFFGAGVVLAWLIF